jgi:SHS2 domain-containing protein
MPRSYLAHTADLRARVEAPDLAGLYAEAATLVREIVVGDSPVAPRERRRIALAGDDDGERFFRFLRELVYLYDAEGFLPAAARLAGDAVEVDGEPFDPARHVSERQLKAVTRHRYLFARDAEGCASEVVFDL